MISRLRKYKLTDGDKDWVEQAIAMDLTRLEMRKKLLEVQYPEERIECFIDYYDNFKSKQLRDQLEQTPQKATRVLEENKKFEEGIKQYVQGNKKEMSWNQRRAIKKFLKNVDNYSKTLKVATEGFKRELDYVSEKGLGQEDLQKELKYLKEEIIDRIIDSKGILDIEHPETGEEVTKENLTDLDIEVLIKLLYENVKVLEEVVNGKLGDDYD